MPAAYLVKRAYIHGVPFYVDERVIVPRSYIGELMFSGIFGGDEAPLIEDVTQVTSVLDLCTGSGCLAIIAAGIFPDAEIDAADLSRGRTRGRAHQRGRARPRRPHHPARGRSLRGGEGRHL